MGAIHLAFEHCPELFVIYDPQRRYLHLNRAAVAATGRAAADFIGRRDEEIWPPAIHGRYLPALEEAVRTRQPRRFELEPPGPLGGAAVREVTYVPVLDAAGELQIVLGLATDVTERARARRRLSDLAAELESTYAGLPIGLCALDRELRCVRINEHLAEIDGLPAAEHLGRTLREVVPDLAPRLEEGMRAVLESGRPRFDVPIEGETAALPGVLRHWLEHWLPLRDASGAIIGLNVVVEEVTERRRMEAALQASERRYRATFDHAGVGIAHVSLDGCILRLNDRLCEIFRRPRAELVGRTFQELTHPDDLGKDLEQARELLEGRIDSYTLEKRYLLPDGGVAWASLTGSLMRGADGKPRYFIAVAEDIGSRKAAQEALRESEQRLRLALEAGRAAEWDWDLRSDRAIWSDRLCELLGARPATPTGEAFLARVHPEDRRDLQAVIADGLQSGEFAAEFRVCRPDGVVLWFACRALVLKDAAGEPVRIVGLDWDISPQKRLEAELRSLTGTLEQRVDERTTELADAVRRLSHEIDLRQEMEAEMRRRSQLLEGFFRHTVTLLAFLDGNFNFVRVNDAYAGAAGRRPGWFPGRNYFDVHPDEETRAIFREVIASGRPYQARAKAFAFPERPREATFWNWQLVPLLDAEGRIEFLFLNLEDVTQRQHAMQALEERARLLQKLALELSAAEDRERRRIADVLHDDLQQLLVGAKLHLELLSARLPPDGSQAIAQQVADLLDASIQKSRGLSHELSPPMLAQAGLGQTLGWLGGRMEAQLGLVVTVVAGPEAEPDSEALRVFLYRTAQELLFNVVKHAGTRTAAVALARRGAEIELTVGDQGCGFDPAAVRARREAAGFGLFSIQERVDLMGGRMEIETGPGRGCRVRLTVPHRTAAHAASVLPAVAAARSGPATATGSIAGRICRILLVDDHAVMREGLAALLDEEPDLEVVGQAADGEQAIALAGRLRPDVVVMDAAMPLMDGAEATRRIKALPHPVRVVGLSMFEEAEVAARMLSAGCDAYLAKTGPPADLLLAVRGGVGATQQGAAAGGAAEG